MDDSNCNIVDSVSKSSVGNKNSLIFLSSDACTTACEEMEPVAKEMAEKAGLSFSKMKYSQPVQIPGCVVVKDDVLTIFGANDKESFAQQICTITKNEDICGEAERAGEEAEQEASKTAEQKCADIAKVGKPKLEVFYVSRCPFGVQSLNALYYVAKNFGDKVDIVPRLLVNKAADGKSTTSMHGEEEHKEDLRQICLQKEQSLADCAKNRAEGYALKEAEALKTDYTEASGSPSFFLNGEKINEYEFSANGRSPENIKNIICCSMKTKGVECDKQLQTAQPPRGFGKLEGSAAATASSGQQLNCG